MDVGAILVWAFVAVVLVFLITLWAAILHWYINELLGHYGYGPEERGMSYTVTDVSQIERMTPGGGKQIIYKVHYVTGRGSTGTVEVSPDDWDTERLREILAEEAERLDLPYSFE